MLYLFKSPLLSLKKRKLSKNDDNGKEIINPLSQNFPIGFELRQRIKLSRWWIKYNLGINEEAEIKDKIIQLAVSIGFNPTWVRKIIRHAVSEFSKKGLGSDYYGYHNIEHELEATYFTLIAANSVLKTKGNNLINLGFEDIKYLFVSALFHDYDPLKQFDKPNEESIEWFIRNDPKIIDYVKEIGIDINLVLILIYRTAYPFKDRIAENSRKRMVELFYNTKPSNKRESDKNNIRNLEYYEKLGWFLSVCERMAGYTIGDFEHAKELARRNAHALGWHPSRINKESVLFFNSLTSEKEMIDIILNSIPKKLCDNFQNNIRNFITAWEEENRIKSLIEDKEISLTCKVEKIDEIKEKSWSFNENLINSIANIYKDTPIPLKMNEKDLTTSLYDPGTILVTLRVKRNTTKIDNGKIERDGDDVDKANDLSIIGFVKGSSLENYKLRRGTFDENFGKKNTIFMEWICIKSGYLGAAGGNLLRTNFIREAKSRGYTFLASYVHRNVIRNRIDKGEIIQTVQKYDPDKLDYYRIDLSQFDIEFNSKGCSID